MTQQNLQQAYSRQNWQTWLADIFGSQVQFETQAETIDIDRDNIKSVQRFASVNLADGKNLAVFDIETHADVQIARNRVGLRKLVDKYIDHARYHGILAFYHCSETADSRGVLHTPTLHTPQYRMSFISSEPKIDADGNFLIEQTEPKRYTYVLGENEKTKTPAKRLEFIAKKQGKASLEDVKNAFSVETLTKEFYAELFAWYEWALSEEIGVKFPSEDKKTEEHLIRLITRLIFVWFIKQKKLIPNEIFETEKLSEYLKNFDASSTNSGNYYNAILQNLFFATLNRPIGERAFATDKSFQGKDEHYGIKTLFRDAGEGSFFKKSQDEIVDLFRKVPFLNGGLFECLDKENDGKIVYFDGFSRVKKRRAFLPNILFFEKDKGLISILKRYNFTIEENSPQEVEVALDPELLGKVFENLLGAYNPETKETARRQSGSFYTPREIVNYMVDESLKAYCLNCDFSDLFDYNDYKMLVETLFSQDNDIQNHINQTNHAEIIVQTIIQTIKAVKILDPACGSGAFPMGILNRMIDILKKLDPNINLYKTKLDLIENCIYGVDIQTIAIQISKLRFFISLIVEQTPNDNPNTNYGILPLPNLESKFIAANTLISLDEHRKDQLDLQDTTLKEMKDELWNIRNHRNLRASSWQEKVRLREDDKKLCEQIEKYLIENTVKPDEKRIAENRALIEKLEAEISELKPEWVDDYETQMSLFGEDTPQKLFQKDLNEPKRNRLVESIKLLNAEIAKEEKKAQLTGLEAEIKKMTSWDLYDQNAVSPFFDAEWMFGLSQENDRFPYAEKGFFDVVIGNPPYVDYRKIDTVVTTNKNLPISFKSNRPNLYQFFIEKGDQLLNENGILCFINPNQFLSTDSGFELRKYLIEKRNILFIADVSYIKVFESAATYPIVYAFNKNGNRNIRVNKCLDLSKLGETTFYILQEDLMKSVNKIIPTNPTFFLLSKIEDKCSLKLMNVAKLKWGTSAAGYGKLKIKEEGFEKLPTSKKNEYKPILQTADTKRFYIDWKKEFIPISIYSKQIIEEFNKEKIVIGRVTKSIQACLDSENHFVGKSTLITDSKIDLKILLAILNSSFANRWYYLKYETTHMAGGYLRFDIPYLENLPIPNITFDQQQPIINLVNQILSAKKENPQANTSALEQEIDTLVYELYGLTEEEIEIIEG